MLFSPIRKVLNYFVTSLIRPDTWYLDNPRLFNNLAGNQFYYYSKISQMNKTLANSTDSSLANSTFSPYLHFFFCFLINIRQLVCLMFALSRLIWLLSSTISSTVWLGGSAPATLTSLRSWDREIVRSLKLSNVGSGQYLTGNFDNTVNLFSYSEEESQMALYLLPFWGGAIYPLFQLHQCMREESLQEGRGKVHAPLEIGVSCSELWDWLARVLLEELIISKQDSPSNLGGLKWQNLPVARWGWSSNYAGEGIKVSGCGGLGHKCYCPARPNNNCMVIFWSCSCVTDRVTHSFDANHAWAFLVGFSFFFSCQVEFDSLTSLFTNQMPSHFSYFLKSL